MVGNGGWATPEAEPWGDDAGARRAEVASLLATAYLRLLLANKQDAATPDVRATSDGKECPPRAHEGLEVPERKSVHVSRD